MMDDERRMAMTSKLPTSRLAAASLFSLANDAVRQGAEFLQSIDPHGGYAGSYSRDLQERHGESSGQPLSASTIWIQPPGTSAVGEVFLRAYRVTGESEYLDAAIAVGRALWWAQHKSGGWTYTGDMKGFDLTAKRPLLDKPCTFDDNTTQAALRFLMHLNQEDAVGWLHATVQLGLSGMMQSQWPNGAWSQWYPLKGGIGDLWTFNDAAINNWITTALEAHRLYGDQEYLDSATRGGDFIILSQLSDPQAGWAQQYGHDLKPAWGRDYEPPAVCSEVTARNIETLIDLFDYTGDSKYLRPIKPAITWLERSKLFVDGQWARLYELETNRPIYGNDDRKVRYDQRKARPGYRWRGLFGVPEAIQRYERILEARRVDFPIWRIVMAQDRQGRWVSDDGRIHARDFVKNSHVLLDYLEANKGTGDGSG